MLIGATTPWAKGVAKEARQEVDRRVREIALACRQKQNPGAGFRRASGSVSRPEMTQVSRSVSAPTSPGSISTLTSISRRELYLPVQRGWRAAAQVASPRARRPTCPARRACPSRS